MTGPVKYRHKPEEVEAWQVPVFDPHKTAAKDHEELLRQLAAWVDSYGWEVDFDRRGVYITDTKSGGRAYHAKPGEYIVLREGGWFSISRSDTFDRSYDRINDRGDLVPARRTA